MTAVAASGAGRLSRGLVLVMAVSTGLAVANNYYAQPLLPLIGRDLHMGAGLSGLIVTVTQSGYALGLFFLLPLGDLVERRRLVVVLSLATATGLVWLGDAGSAAFLLPAALVVGICTVLAQVLVPFAASLAGEHERGRVVGLVMSGLLIGILLARTLAGLLAETGTWRVVYFAAAGAMVVEAAVLHWALPTWHERPGLRYRTLLGSVVALVGQERLLRRRALYGFFSFGTFSVLWTSMAFLLAHRYHYSSGVIGLFGLAGAAGAMTATVAGRLSDGGRASPNTYAATTILVLPWLALWAGSSSVAALIAGVVLLDIGAQGLHITNQSEIYRLRPEARSRLTAAYMVIYFIGGAIGSAVSALLYGHLGWDGVCLAGGGFAVADLAAAVVLERRLPSAWAQRSPASTHVQGTRPGRTQVGGLAVQSTTVEGAPSQRPPSTTSGT
jgi:predicted MFS family arabinose efflux permease